MLTCPKLCRDLSFGFRLQALEPKAVLNPCRGFVFGVVLVVAAAAAGGRGGGGDGAGCGGRRGGGGGGGGGGKFRVVFQRCSDFCITFVGMLLIRVKS